MAAYGEYAATDGRSRRFVGHFDSNKSTTPVTVNPWSIMLCGMDERQAAKLTRAVLIYSLSMMVSGMATAITIYILLPIEVVFGIAVVVALISTVIAIRANRKIKALAKSQADEAKSARGEPSSQTH